MSYVRGPGVQHWHSIDTLTSGLIPHQAGPPLSGTAWPSANMAIYQPFIVNHRVVVRKLWFSCAATGTGNYDIGLYDVAGTRLVSSGSTSKPASATEAVADVTDTTIGPGVYYVALASNSGTDTFYGFTPAAPVCAALGVLTQASAFALPATATMAVNQTLAFWPVVGMLLDTRVS